MQRYLGFSRRDAEGNRDSAFPAEFGLVAFLFERFYLSIDSSCLPLYIDYESDLLVP